MSVKQLGEKFGPLEIGLKISAKLKKKTWRRLRMESK